MTRTIAVNSMPERTVVQAILLGIIAVNNDPTLLDTIFATIGDEELAQIKAYWARNPPEARIGYPREDARMPMYAVTIASDDGMTDYIGIGEETEILDDASTDRNLFGRRLRMTTTIYVYADHPDVCAWLYRILRRILGVATKWLITRELTEPTLSGAELAPDPRYVPSGIYVRRLNLSFEYEEGWTDDDALWAVFYATEPAGGGGATAADATAIEARLSSAGTLNIQHADAGGGVTPDTE